jgi:uncharacterized membrane protein
MTEIPPDDHDVPDDDPDELLGGWNPADELTTTRFIPTQPPPRAKGTDDELASASGDANDEPDEMEEVALEDAIADWQASDNEVEFTHRDEPAVASDMGHDEPAGVDAPKNANSFDAMSLALKAKELFVRGLIKGHAHSHAPGDHDHEDVPLDPRLKRILLWIVLPFVAVTFIGLIVLWPSPTVNVNNVENEEVVGRSTLEKGVVRTKEIANCPGTTDDNNVKCQFLIVEITTGPEAGKFTQLELSVDPPQVQFSEGDRIILNRLSVCSSDNPDTAILQTPECTQELDPAVARDSYSYTDFDRDSSMALLLVLFVAAVLLIGRWQGLKSLISLAISLWVIVQFVVPAVFEGRNPVWVSIIGASLVLLLALYLTHGVTARTTAALVGTYGALLLTALLATIFANLGNFTGATSEDATFIQALQGDLNLRGLLLGGIIIGAIGVLDDVTVTQSSAVSELHAANPSMNRLQLYRSAMNIGRDHVGSAVNTLALAYAGAAMPLLLVFTVFNRGLVRTVTNEIVAQEVLRTMVGSMGLIASVPLTTAFAAWIVTYGRANQPSPLACFVPEALADRFRVAYGHRPVPAESDSAPAEHSDDSRRDSGTRADRTPDPDFWRD